VARLVDPLVRIVRAAWLHRTVIANRPPLAVWGHRSLPAHPTKVVRPQTGHKLWPQPQHGLRWHTEHGRKVLPGRRHRGVGKEVPVELGSPAPPTAEPRQRRYRMAKAAAGAAVAVGLGLGVTAVAGAVTTPTDDSGSTSTSTPAAGATPNAGSTAPAAPDGGGRHGPGHGGPGGFGGPGIHGEFTVPGPNSGYETLDSQIGQVTAVSNTSITVKSEDGFEKTYVVDTDSVVNAGRDGIADVKTGETVRVLAVANGQTANAKQIEDVTSLGNHRQTWEPRHPAPPAPGGTTG